MGMTTRLELGWNSVIISSATERFIPVTDWMPAAGYTAGRGWVETRVFDGALSVAAAVQVANHPDAPDAHTKVHPLVTKEEVGSPDSTLTVVSTAGWKYIRGGFAVLSSSGVAAGQVSGVVELLVV